MKVNQNRAKYILNCRGKILTIHKPLVMGIVNLTPDSFYAGSRTNEYQLLEKVDSMISDGASILDFGGYSSRPGATDISINEEINRVLPAIKLVREKHPEMLISLDTFRNEVLESCLDFGVDFVNDISGGKLDPKLAKTAAKRCIPYIIMHMRGTPQNMQDNCSYDNLIMEVNQFFSKQIQKLKKVGVKDIIIDAGFGFSKDLNQNFELMNHLDQLQIHDLPVLTGVSRKSMIYKQLNSTPEEALNGTTAMNYHALMNGSKILRVHDVKEVSETIELFWKTVNS